MTNIQPTVQGKTELLPGPFISYSRRDLPFARRLYEALRRRNRDAWVDLEGIEPSEEWLGKLYRAIDSSQAFVFIISEHSVASPYCDEEVRRAGEGNKKLIPILYRQVAPERLPPALAKLQWISFQDEGSFESGVDELISALDTDLEWINEHTRLLVRAREWEREAKEKSYLLRGKDLKEAEQWLIDSARTKDRQPTVLQSTYIGASAQMQRRSRNRLLAGTSAAAIIAGLLAVAAVYQRNQAQANERQAVSRLLAAQATAGIEQNFNLSLLLAAAAYQRAPTFEARQVLQAMIEASPHLAKYLYGQSERVQRLAFDASGRLLASSSMDGRVIVWDASSGREIFRSAAHAKSSPGIAISGEARLLAFGGEDGTMRLHHLDTREAVAQITSDQKANIPVAAFSPDGRQLAWGDAGGRITIWNTQSRERRCASAETHRAPLTALRYAPDGESLASKDYSGTSIIWSSESCRKISQMDATGGGSFAAISADLQRTVSTDAGFPEVHLGGLVDGSAKRTVVGSDFLLAVDFNPRDTSLALGTRDAAIMFWEPDSGKIRQKLRGHRGDVTSVAFDPGGRWLASGSIHGEVILWDLSIARPMEVTATWPQPSVASVYFSADGRRILAANRDGKLLLWDRGTTRSTPINITWPAKPMAISAGPNIELLAAQIAGRILIRRSNDGATVDEIPIESRETTPLIFSPDGRYLAFGDGGQAFLRDIAQRKTIAAGTPHKNSVALAFDRSSQKLAFTGANAISIVDLPTMKRTEISTPGHTSYIRSIAISPDGKILATGGGMYDGNVGLWNIENGRLLRFLRPDDPTDVALMFFFPDGRTLATITAYSDALRLWDVASGRLLRASIRLGESLNSVTAAYNPRGDLLATVQKDAIILYDLAPDKLIESICRAANRNLTIDEWRDNVGPADYQATCPEPPTRK